MPLPIVYINQFKQYPNYSIPFINCGQKPTKGLCRVAYVSQLVLNLKFHEIPINKPLELLT